MTTASSGGLGQHFLDTGPLLCLGGSPVIADLYDQEFAADALVVEVVVDEVRRIASEYLAAGDPRRIGGRKKAGAAASKRYARSLFSAAIPRPTPEPAEVHKIKQDLEDRAKQKRGGGRASPGEHAGETFSIYEARQRTARFVANDDGARQVASLRSVANESFVDVVGRLSRCQVTVKPRALLKEIQQLVRQGIDPGDVVNSVLDLKSRGSC